MNIKLLTEHNLEFLSLTGGCTSSCESARQNATLLEITCRGSCACFFFNRVDPFYASAHNNIGIILENRTEAEVHFHETLKIAPSHLGAHVNLGNLLL